MRAHLFLVTLAAGLSSTIANPPLIVVQPPQQTTVLSRLTPSTAQSNQLLLNQVNASLSQRRFEHQLSTTQAAIRAQAIPVRITPSIVIQPK